MNKIRKTLLLMLLVCLFPTSLYADDTEIFFSRATADNNDNVPAANVMILLDTSGSMRYCESDLGFSGNQPKWCNKENNRRIVMLIDAFNTMIDNVPNGVRIGVSRFRRGETDGGHVMVPVVEVDSQTTQVLKDAVVSTYKHSSDPTGGTPTSEAYYEMRRYMMGQSPIYGEDGEGGYSQDFVCLEYAQRPITVPDYNNVINRKEVNYCNIDNNDCVREGSFFNRRYYKLEFGTKEIMENYCADPAPIVEDGRYVSPMKMNNQCEANYVIVMTDGAPSKDFDELPSNLCSSATGSISSSYTCQEKTAKYLNSTSNAKGREVFTSNIGLYMGGYKDDMEGVSKAGGGQTYNAESAQQLAQAFIDELDLIDENSRSIASPGVAINQMNRFQHLDQLYYSVFEPTSSSFWEGNLKRYQLEGGVIKGQNGAAVSESTGYFKNSAQSFWSEVVDGYDAKVGGARDEVSERKLFYSTSNANKNLSKLDWDQVGTTGYLGKTDLGLDSTATDADLNLLLDQLKVVWGDPLHSVPLMVNYGGKSENNIVFVSNNAGMLHAIDVSDGSEEFAFMPHDFLKRADEVTTNKLGLNTDNTRQSYGLDGSWVSWRKPGESVTDKPEAVYIYGGMRRGGRNYYALDVTSLNSPKMQFSVIEGGSGDFDDLGQTWSTPTLTQIPVGDETKPVLVFGGGYDPAGHDNRQGMGRVSGDSMGNAIYIVDAENGSLIWSGTSKSNANLKWSVPGGISVVDKEFDGVADFLYFGDLGGQLFRVDIDQSGNLNNSVHRLASLGGSSASTNRRFYDAPSVVYLNEGGQKVLYVAAASGYRSHPLDEKTQDGVFVVKDKTAMAQTITAPEDVSLSQMTNVSNGEADSKDMGWFYYLESAEKSMSSPVVFDGVLRFSTYSPKGEDLDDNPCAVSYGRSFLHTVDIVTSKPATNNDGTVPDSRREDLDQTTPPPSPVLVTDGEGNIDVVVGTEVVGEQDMGYSHLRKRRWYQMDETQANEFKAPPGDEEE
ncbi:PilC/PilY family type IV pilus protein [Alcanivorax sp.]|jgi:type IV pilus assembly protein PilY1|uniref:PilC/PilY family type IV pilus protein n=1 Tax=Alcanivorax sp. TaxID=1872427 RepID=UPI0032D99130